MSRSYVAPSAHVAIGSKVFLCALLLIGLSIGSPSFAQKSGMVSK